MHALSWLGDWSLKKVEDLVRPRLLWSKGVSGTIVPMKHRRAWRGQWPRKSSFASFWSIVFTSHILLANKNRVFFKFFPRFCQVFTPNMKQVNFSGWRIECRICTDSCLRYEYMHVKILQCTQNSYEVVLNFKTFCVCIQARMSHGYLESLYSLLLHFVTYCFFWHFQCRCV